MLKPIFAAACAAPFLWTAAFADPTTAPPPAAPTAAAPAASAPPASEAGQGAPSQGASSQGASSQGAKATPDVATLLFSDPQWGQAPAGSTITYAYTRKLADPALGSSVDDQVAVKLTAGDNAQSRTADVTAFTQHSPQAAGPFTSDEQNPVLLVFLENNVQELSRLFKANPRYFKTAIRRAWRENAKVERTTIDVNGHQTPGTRITVQPFAGDAEASRMLGLDGMVYTVDIADSVPGNIAAIDIRAPASGAPKFSETLRYEAIKKS